MAEPRGRIHAPMTASKSASLPGASCPSLADRATDRPLGLLSRPLITRPTDRQLLTCVPIRSQRSRYSALFGSKLHAPRLIATTANPNTVDVIDIANESIGGNTG